MIHSSCKGPRAKRVWVWTRIWPRRSTGSIMTICSASRRIPRKGMIAGWLKAGVFEPGKGFAPTREGTPQGGVISPLLMNVALHGLEEAAGVRYLTSGVRAGDIRPGSPTVIRYADDLVALCHSQEQAWQVKARLAAWLAPRGLAFNEDKTQIVHLIEGFDFLGFSVRRYSGRKLLVKPSKAAVKRLRARLAAEVRSLRGLNALAVVTKLNPIIKGWAAYYRSAVSGEYSRRWTTICGSCSTSGPRGAIMISRKAGSSAGISASTTSSGTTTGYSAPPAPAPTSLSSPGPTSSGTSWSRAGCHPTTRNWPILGRAAAEGQTPAGRLHHATAYQAERAVPALRGPAPVR